MSIAYGYRWSHAHHCLTEVWDEARARKSHAKRKIYTALISEPLPRRYIEFNNTYIGVGFLDDAGSMYLKYSFYEVKPQVLFLRQATHYELGEGGTVSKQARFAFEEAGKVTIVKDDYQLKSQERCENEIDVDGNWEGYPEFARYESICRENR